MVAPARPSGAGASTRPGLAARLKSRRIGYAASWEAVVSLAGRAAAVGMSRSFLQTLAARTLPHDHVSIRRASLIEASRLLPSISQSQLALLGERPSWDAAC